ncbi:ABC transporter permease [Spiroplasma endosymbiont of Aspidapion aeneum]|uniref:ABC transporter permease n=1 Tax=Spiroplasma endosymbiont of Aspidapion aeneum TaxID=3066276 RepID=UPI00313D7B8D
MSSKNEQIKNVEKKNVDFNNNKLNNSKINLFISFKEISILLLKSFFRSPRGPLFMYIVPTFFSWLFYSIYKDYGVSILLSYTLLPCFTILTSLSIAIIEWKNSVFLKRIDGSGIKKSIFLFAIWFNYLIISYSGFTLQILFGVLITKGDFYTQVLKNVNWLVMIFAVTLVSITCIAISTLIGGIINNEGSGTGIVMMVYFLCIFLGGVMIPTSVIETSTFMRILSYIVPLKYAVAIFHYSLGEEVYNSMTNGDFSSIFIPIGVAFAILITLFVATMFTFKWSSKK